jgi:hypothetical protein
MHEESRATCKIEAQRNEAVPRRKRKIPWIKKVIIMVLPETSLFIQR